MLSGRRLQSWGTAARLIMSAYSLVIVPSPAVTVTVTVFFPPERSTW